MLPSLHLKSRREVIGGLAGLAGGAVLLRGNAQRSEYRPLLAAQTYVWTQVLSAQKRSLAEGIEEIFSGTKRAGYQRIELVTPFVLPDLREKTAALLKKYGLEVPIVYAGGPMHKAELAQKTIGEVLKVADTARSIGARIINSNPSPKPRRERKSDGELEIQARFVDRLGVELRKRGMRLILHHHAPEMAEDAREWRHLLKHTDAKLVGICLDTDWVVRGGQDLMPILQEAGPRLASLHLRNSQHGVWTESLGEGDYDYPAVAAYLKKIGFRGYLVVELAHEKKTQITRPLEENLRLSRVYAEKVFGVQ